jgi:hypothetical protein
MKSRSCIKAVWCSERDTGEIRLSSVFPPELPAWIENAFAHCATRYGIELSLDYESMPAQLGEQVDPLYEISSLPEEITDPSELFEGAVCTICVNAFERSPEARRQCIAVHGTTCSICGCSFGEIYGPEAEGYIHVHHLRPLSKIGHEYQVDPAEDLRPVCPNCHAVIHLGGRCRSIEEVKQMLRLRCH